MTEMANISKEFTLLPVNIWVEESGVERDVEHNEPHLKFQNSKSNKLDRTKLIPISISNEEPIILIKDFDMKKLELSGKEFKVLQNWIRYHYDLLIKYWNSEIDTTKLISNINRKEKDWKSGNKKDNTTTPDK